jgi:hypothetical protein
VPALAVPLTQGKSAFIDPEDAALVATGHTWSAQRRENGLWYAVAYVRGSARNGGTGRYIGMHILVSGISRPDHVDRNGLNNTRINLRPAATWQNGGNTGKRKGTSSRFKGVTFVSRTGRWAAQLHHLGRKTHLGYFVEEEEAARGYDRAAMAHFGEFAATNVALGLLPPEEG